MLAASDRAAQEKLYQAVKKASADVDSALTALIGDPKVAAKKGQLEEFKAVWEQFKTTRDAEIVPALYSGDVAKAKGLATGVQKERVAKMNGLIAQPSE